MTREQIFTDINDERAYQNTKWGTEFDKKNTANDWATYIMWYLSKATSEYPLNQTVFRKNMIKVAALAVAALELDEVAGRHYD